MSNHQMEKWGNLPINCNYIILGWQESSCGFELLNSDEHISAQNKNLLIEISTIRINTLLPMQNKCIYARNVKILRSGGDEVAEGVFDIA